MPFPFEKLSLVVFSLTPPLTPIIHIVSFIDYLAISVILFSKLTPFTFPTNTLINLLTILIDNCNTTLIIHDCFVYRTMGLNHVMLILCLYQFHFIFAYFLMLTDSDEFL